MQLPLPQDSSRLAACPKCETFPLEDLGTELVCGACTCRYPVANGVPILIPGVTGSRSFAPSDEFIKRISEVYQLPVAREFGDRLRDVFSHGWTIPSLGLHAESTQFLDRVRSGGDDVPPLDRHEPSVDLNGAAPAKIAESEPSPRCRWLLHYIPPVMAVGSRGAWNVRFENTGSTPISSAGERPVQLSYYWRTADGAVIDGLLTPLPIEIAPGRQITMPMLIQSPPEPGRYSLSVGFSGQSGEFLLLRTLPIEVAASTPDLCTEWNHRGIEFDYDADHLDAIQLVLDRVRKLRWNNPRILEIGGNASPMIRDFRGELYNVDVDVHGMQVGYLTNRECDGSIRFYVADANALPFPDGFFDVILIFSSVHHMPDPRASLRHFARKLKLEGLMGVLCEPVGHYYGDDIDPALLRELRKGLNEQTFSLEEWSAIFQAAGLCEREVIVDKGSLKALLGSYF